MPKAASTAVIKPNLGLYLDRPPIAIPPGGLQDGLNFRIQLGQLNNLNIGWALWQPKGNATVLNGPCTLIQWFATSEGNNFFIFGTPTDLYQYNPSTGLQFISPTYTTGTVAVSANSATVTGTGTSWNATVSGDTWVNAKAGDQISFGSASVTSPGAVWYTIASVGGATTLTLTENVPAAITAGTAYTLRRRFTGSGILNQWQTEVFVDIGSPPTDFIYFTNGLDNVCYWNGSTTTVVKSLGLGFTCKTLCQFKDVMVYGNVVQSGNPLETTIITSDAGLPNNAGAASTGIAGQFIVQGGTDPIQNCKRIGDYLAIYCQHTVIVVQAVGAPLIYVFRIAVQGKGPVAPNGISIFPYSHQFIAPDGMYTFDGNTAQPVNTHVWRNVLSTIDKNRQGDIFTFLDEVNGEQIWSVPQTNDPGIAIGTIARVQTGGVSINQGSSTTSTVSPLANNPTPGNTVIVTIATGTLTGTTTSVVDSNGNTYTASPDSNTNIGGFVVANYYLLDAPTNATKTLTVTYGVAQTQASVIGAEYSGIIGFDHDLANSQASGTVTGPATLANYNSALYFVGTQSASPVTTINAPWTLVATDNGNLCADRITTGAPSAQTPVSTSNGGGDIALVSVFYPQQATTPSPNALAWTEHYLEETAGQAQSALIASAMGLNRPYSKRNFPFTAIGNFLNQSVVTWNQLVNAWQTYNYRWTDAFFSATFPIVLAGDINGVIYQLNVSQVGNLTPLQSFVTFGRRALIDGRMRALLRRVYPFVNSFPNNLNVQCAFTDFASDSVPRVATFSYAQTQTNTDTYFVPIYRRGRYVDLTFGDVASNPWQLNGYDLDVLPGGMR